MTKKRKYILHLTPFAEFGGCEVNCLRIIKAWSDCDHQVVVFADRGPMSGGWEDAGARTVHLGAWMDGSSRFAAALAGWVGTQDRPDGIIYWSASRLPTVLRAMGALDSPWAVHLGNPRQGSLLSLLRTWNAESMHLASTAVTLVACSRHVADSYMNSRFFRRFRMEVIHNPVDPSFDIERAHRPLPQGSSPRVGMIARLDSIKDHQTVISALAALASSRADIMVEFAGDGPLLESLKRKALQLSINERVKFLGFIPVGPLLSQWDIYVHSTTQSEGMGTAVAEAMMAGLPCLVSDLGVMREVCGPEGAAYAPAGDAEGFASELLRLIDDRDRRETLGHAAQERARRMFGLSQASSAYARVVFAPLAKERR